MASKIELATRDRILNSWTDFQNYRSGTESHALRGRRLNESDVRAVLERLLTDVLGYEAQQIDREPDFADFVILYRGMKLIVIETKDWDVFQNQHVMDDALKQAANYADRHKIKTIFVFDGSLLLRASRSGESIDILTSVTVSGGNPSEELFYFTQYGLDKAPESVQRRIVFAGGAEDSDIPAKTHHGVRLPYTSFAYIGDLRDKKTWKMPYRNADGTVDLGRIDKAVSFLFSKSGYRGVQASERSVPEAAQPEVARKLAVAYQEVGRWEAHSSYKSVNVLWDYLESRGETDLK